MLRYRNIIFNLGTVVIGGALLSLIYLLRVLSPAQALLFGYFNACTFAVTLWILRKFLLLKLSVFTPAQQWILKTLIYVIMTCFVYLLGLLFQYLVLTPVHIIGDVVVEKLWRGFFLIVSDPLRLDLSTLLQAMEFRRLILPFFAVIVLLGIGSLVASYIELKWQDEKHTRLLQKAELAALRTQMEPHFLFNTLNTIAAAIRTDPQQAEQLVVRLSDLFRYIFDNSGRDIIELEKEISFTRVYTDLLKARYGDLLQINWNQNVLIPGLTVPVFIIQPLLENSIRHGWSAERECLRMEIRIREEESKLIIEIEDDGQGMRPDLVQQVLQGKNALANIVERLRLHYGEKGRMEIDSVMTRGTRVRLTIPGGTL
jgi:hypothetical protein